MIYVSINPSAKKRFLPDTTISDSIFFTDYSFAALNLHYIAS
jgi:hypothetical protein